MKVFITKYALTEGIQVIDAEIRDGMAIKGQAYFHVEGRDWHRSSEAALERAEKMRLAKIASLQKQLEKCTRLRFS